MPYLVIFKYVLFSILFFKKNSKIASLYHQRGMIHVFECSILNIKNIKSNTYIVKVVL